MGFNWFDIVLVSILLITMILGFIKGLIRQIVGIAAVVAGLILAAFNYPWAAGFFTWLVNSEKWANFLGFLLIFFAVLGVGGLIAWLLSKLMKGPLKFVNHLLGGIFGLLKGILICGVLVLAFLVFPIQQGALEKSYLAPYCFGVSKAIVHLIPQELKVKFRLAYEEIMGRIKKDGQKI